jgi:hypothetical protein
MDGVTQVVLESFGVQSFEQLYALPTAEVVKRMDEVSAHGGDKALTVLVLKAVADLLAASENVGRGVAELRQATSEVTEGIAELRAATADVVSAAESTDRKTDKLVRAAWLTLAVAVVTLIATIVIATTS